MMELMLLRHGESDWNRLNLFTGWTDVDLSRKGRQEAIQAGKTLLAEGYDFDICYTSLLKRAIHTLDLLLDAMDRVWLPVEKNWKLNERHYGALQGLNKAETAEKYGEEQVLIWRRSFDVPPPKLEPEDSRSPRLQPQYRGIDGDLLPLSESLKDTIGRVLPYFQEVIAPSMRAGKRVLITAHGNSLRALIQSLEGLTPAEIMAVNIPTGVPLLYQLADDFSVCKKCYLGDAKTVTSKIAQVAAQGKRKK